MKRAGIIGVGAIKAGRYANRTEMELATDAICLALDDAQVDKAQIDAVFTTPDLRDSIGLQLNLLCESLRIRPKLTAEVTCGAIAPGLAVRFACNEIALGNIDVALCYGAEREASIGWFRDFGSGAGSPRFDPFTQQPYGSRGVVWAYAMSARRYMHETGATERHFALASVRDRNNALTNPLAGCTKPITVEDVLRSPPLCTPIKLLDVPVSLDGAAAVIVASEEFAAKVCAKPVFVAGLGQYHDDSNFIPTDGCDKPISSFISTRKAAASALQRAGVGLDDIDVAELYAPFSSHELMVAEDIGWFEKGGMIAAIENGATHIGGRIPINTDGGLLSRGHPWAATPFYEMITIVKQLRGEMGENQVEGARTGLVHCEAGMLNTSLIMILRSE